MNTPKLSGNVSHCRACGLTFTSIHSFDQHRTGHYPARRCKTEDDLRAAGMSPNEQGRWRVPREVSDLAASRHD
jgi:hypothetical protein